MSSSSSAERPRPGVVGIAYSPTFLLHGSVLKRREAERPARLEAIRDVLVESGAWARLAQLPTRPATDEELCLVHSAAYVKRLSRLAALPSVDEQRARCKELMLEGEDLIFNEHTVSCARLAAGSCIEAVEAVLRRPQGDACASASASASEASASASEASPSTATAPIPPITRAIAVVRPPGHHAEAHCAQGFCVFNNVAVAARHAVARLNVQRLLVVDWDVHHGNGTQREFLHDARVLYASVHRHDAGRFYPRSELAGADTVGRGAAAGRTVNVAWSGGGHGDAEYQAAWDRVVLPVARAFAPELVLVSAGFDAARGDAMGECDVTPRGFAALTRQLVALPSAQGRIVLVLEGGYHLPSLSASVAACVDALLDPDPSLDPDPNPNPSPSDSNHDHDSDQDGQAAAFLRGVRESPVDPGALASIAATVKAHQPYWPGLT